MCTFESSIFLIPYESVRIENPKELTTIAQKRPLLPGHRPGRDWRRVDKIFRAMQDDCIQREEGLGVPIEILKFEDCKKHYELRFYKDTDDKIHIIPLYWTKEGKSYSYENSYEEKYRFKFTISDLFDDGVYSLMVSKRGDSAIVVILTQPDVGEPVRKLVFLSRGRHYYAGLYFARKPVFGYYPELVPDSFKGHRIPDEQRKKDLEHEEILAPE